MSQIYLPSFPKGLIVQVSATDVIILSAFKNKFR